MKKLLFLFALSLFWIGASAQDTREKTWCTPSVPNNAYIEGMVLSMGDDCECWNFVPYTTGWRDVMCLQNNQMIQERTTTDLIKPFCNEIVIRTEQQVAINELCKKCPASTEMGSWNEVSCASGHPVFAKSAAGYKFNVSVSQCVAVQSALLRVDNEKLCSITTYVSSFYGGIILIAPIIIIFLLIAWKRKAISKAIRRRMR